MSVIRVYDGEDPVKKHQKYKKKSWVQRQPLSTWLLVGGFLLFLCALVGVGIYYLPGLIENGFNLNPFAAPSGYTPQAR